MPGIFGKSFRIWRGGRLVFNLETAIVRNFHKFFSKINKLMLWRKNVHLSAAAGDIIRVSSLWWTIWLTRIRVTCSFPKDDWSSRNNQLLQRIHSRDSKLLRVYCVPYLVSFFFWRFLFSNGLKWTSLFTFFPFYEGIVLSFFLLRHFSN